MNILFRINVLYQNFNFCNLHTFAIYFIVSEYVLYLAFREYSMHLYYNSRQIWLLMLLLHTSITTDIIMRSSLCVAELLG